MAVGLADNRDMPVTDSPYLARVGACVVRTGRRPRTGARPAWDVVLAVSAGGALGSLARWGVGESVPTAQYAFPWATFVENLTGGFLLGALTIVLLELRPPGRYLRPFLGIGVLGGYTTFSAYMLETRDLLMTEQYVGAGAYLFGTLVLGLVAVWLGMWTVRGAIRLRPRRRARDHRTRRSL